MSRSTCTEAATGNWHEILVTLAGVDPALLDGKPHGCPICRDGVDRFTFDNKEGRGTWLCRKCPAAPGKGAGGGDGMKLLQAVTGWDFKRAAAEIERHLRLPSRLPSNGHRPLPLPPAATPPPAFPATPQGPIELLRLPGPAEDVVRLDPDGPIVRLRDGEFICAAVYRYSPSQQTQRLQPVAGGRKQFFVRSKVNGRPTWGAGPDPWPAWRQSEAIAAAKANPDNWVLEGEGEKVAEIAREGGLVCITQPGHAHSVEQIQPRYEALKAAGVAGVVFLADHDAKGHERALKAQGAANTVGLPLVVLPASEVWPTVPEGGSIDDAPGTPAEQAAAIQKVVGLIEPGEWSEVWAEWQRALGLPDPLQQAEAAAGLAPATLDGSKEVQEVQQQDSDLERIRAVADRVVAENINRSRPQYLHRLRELVEADLSVPARDDLYRREIGEAIIRRDGIESLPFVGGQELPDDDDEWVVEGLILAGALNIVGADPKAGKTLWSVALIANLLHGCDQFISRSITSRPQSVIIVGPDQPVKLWKRQLKGVGLVEGNTLDRRIVRLWDSHNPWAATPEGIAELRQVCAAHPGSLVLVDSFARVSEKLGIDENSREAAEVLTDIERACIVHGCTPLVIHHNAKAAGRVGIVNGAALRGNGAIRANASQLLVLTLIEPDNPKDPRRRLVTEGRGTEFIDSVIQLEDNGRSWRHVCEFSEHRSAAKVEKARQKLSELQAEALRAVEGSSERLTTAQVWAAAYPGEPWDLATNECKQLSRTLNQLMDKRLVTRHSGTANRPLWSAQTPRV
ncbi:MAG: AAA family ATPase [Synechococcaceae cyanobacterium]|nr:AAA family ATPase [Synechococcaceae cyanobacterium]